MTHKHKLRKKLTVQQLLVFKQFSRWSNSARADMGKCPCIGLSDLSVLSKPKTVSDCSAEKEKKRIIPTKLKSEMYRNILFTGLKERKMLVT